MNKMATSFKYILSGIFVLLLTASGITNLHAKGTAPEESIETATTVPLPELPSAAAAVSVPDVIVVPNRNTTSELKIRGRIQSQFAYSTGSNSNTGVEADDYDSFEMRRVRLGVQGKLYGDFNFMVEANVLSSVDLDAATLTYAGLPNTNITFGKEKPRFGHEQNTSSASILTFERTRLDGHLNGGKPLGLRLHGNILLLSYYLGVYNGQSVGTGRMGSGSNSYLLNASGSLNLDNLIADGFNTRLRADYLHRTKSSGYYGFEDALAVSGQFGAGGIDLRVEYMTGSEQDQDISGFYVLPSYFLLPGKLQAVLRYENISGDTGVSLGQNRYADRVPNLYSNGDEYNAYYVGVNYYIHSHNLKFMLGYELAENSDSASDASGKASTIFTGFRMQF